ncbi:hypothetical protein [uncultured Veillonella sp.]|uniref:hypothetical protein n=1 Tax=uncultured Veillonella sp. TaxID=159268 RepID=UPI0025DA914E|nr:hypothetical protein [uncultured Veillonella sp.]
MTEFRSKTRLYKVYFIHELGEVDINKGYIGITRRSLQYRLGQHMNSQKLVGRKLRELGRDFVVIEQLAMLPKDKALDMEYQLRPRRHMGWNVMAGGNKKTVRCPMCGKYLPKRKEGTICQTCRPTKFQIGHTPANFGTGEKYRLVSPEGITYEPVSLTQFCRENNLTAQNIRKVAKGKRKHHKGWTAVKIER